MLLLPRRLCNGVPRPSSAIAPYLIVYSFKVLDVHVGVHHPCAQGIQLMQEHLVLGDFYEPYRIAFFAFDSRRCLSAAWIDGYMARRLTPASIFLARITVDTVVAVAYE